MEGKRDRDGEKDREKERKRETEREIERQRDRQTDREKEREKETEGDTEREIERERKREREVVDKTDNLPEVHTSDMGNSCDPDLVPGPGVHTGVGVLRHAPGHVRRITTGPGASSTPKLVC